MGSLEAAYARRFSDYKQADVKTLIRIPKAPKALLRQPTSQFNRRRESGPFVPEHDADRHRSEPQAEVIAEIRIHGNAYVRDEEVIKLAGIAVGQPLPADGLRTIEQRLKASGHFETVEIRKRYRSLESTTDVALVLLVHERPGFTSETIDERPADVGLDASQKPADVPADSWLRRRLWVHVWRTSQHHRPPRRGRAALGAAHLGRHAPRRARVRAHVLQGAAHERRIHFRHLAAARTRTSKSTISGSSGRRAPNGASPASCAPASTRRRARSIVRPDRRPSLDDRRECRPRHSRRSRRFRATP